MCKCFTQEKDKLIESRLPNIFTYHDLFIEYKHVIHQEKSIIQQSHVISYTRDSK